MYREHYSVHDLLLVTIYRWNLARRFCFSKYDIVRRQLEKEKY